MARTSCGWQASDVDHASEALAEVRKSADGLRGVLEAMRVHAEAHLAAVERTESSLHAAAARLLFERRALADERLQMMRALEHERAGAEAEALRRCEEVASGCQGDRMVDSGRDNSQYVGVIKGAYQEYQPVYSCGSTGCQQDAATAAQRWPPGFWQAPPLVSALAVPAAAAREAEGAGGAGNAGAYALALRQPHWAWEGEGVPGAEFAEPPRHAPKEPGPPRVFVFCGHDGRMCLDTTEVLELSSMVVTPGPKTGLQRNVCAVTMLSNRRFLLIGGSHGTTTPDATDTTEVFDLGALRFSPGPSMSSRRGGCAAVRMDENRVIVIGGENVANPVETTEILDLDSMVFTPGPQMRARRNLCTAERLDAGRIIVFGGNDGPVRHNSTEVLDIATLTFSPGPDLSTARAGSAAVRLGDQRLIVFGGFDGRQRLCTTEVLDIASMRFTPGPCMTSRRSGCAAVRIDPQRILILGGVGAHGRLDTTELLDLGRMEFRTGPRMLVPRAGMAAVAG